MGSTREKRLLVYKREGETPLECLFRFRSFYPLYKDAILSYIGRLDPMAEGLLLVLVDEENKKREQYLKLDKVYEVQILFGFKTDTGDILGKLLEANDARQVNKTISDEEKIKNTVNSFVGSLVLPYPMYSSKTVQGKALFKWAREGGEENIFVPLKKSTIFSIKVINRSEIPFKEILKQVMKRIEKVKGDFRQKEIIKSWKSVLKKDEIYPVLSLVVECSSGTYMRSLAYAIGAKLNMAALAWKIKRTEIKSIESEVFK